MFPITCNAFGDIITIAYLVRDIARALSDSQGSTAEYRDFVGELHTMAVTLTKISRVAQQCSDTDLRDRIVWEVGRSWDDFNTSLKRIASVSVLGRGGSMISGIRVEVARQWYKLEWRFSKRSDVQAFQAKFMSSTQRLISLLILLNNDAIDTIRSHILRYTDLISTRDDLLLHTISQIGTGQSFERQLPDPTHCCAHEDLRDILRGISTRLESVEKNSIAMRTFISDTIAAGATRRDPPLYPSYDERYPPPHARTDSVDHHHDRTRQNSLGIFHQLP